MLSKNTPSDIVEGKVYKSNLFGNFEVIKYNGYKNIEVMFVDTGYTCTTSAKSVRKGSVKDCFCPTVCGVGFFGDGSVSSEIQGGHKVAHKQWSSMIRRVYSEKSLNLEKSYKDCSVTVKWHNFQEFCKWFIDNFPNDGKAYHLDKDKKVKGNRIYGPETCSYVSPSENAQISAAKSYQLVNPKGHVVNIHNMSKFCRENGLGKSCMFDLLYGRKSQVKGWKRLP